jgi:hypothetical protein
MTTPPYQPGPYGQPNPNPYGQGGYGQQRPPQQPQYGQPQYGGQYGGANDQTQQFGGARQNPYGTPYGATQQWPGAGGGFGGPTPEPPKKNNGMIIAIVAIALLVLGGSGVGLYLATKDDDGKNSARGGTSTSSSASDKTDSSDEGTSANDEPVEEPVDPGEAIDAQPGDCIKVNVASATNADVETVDCSLPDAMYRVATREETDTGSCPNDQYVSYTEEGQLLLCLQLNVAKGDCISVGSSEDKRTECTSADATYQVLDVLDGVDDETKCADTTTNVITYPQPPLTICLGSPTG